jgi:uncharacterized protein YggL (DUF469 family)
MTAPCPSFGFIVALVFRPDADDLERRRFWRAFTEALEERGLYCTGGGGDSAEYVVASEAAQATDSDRRAVQAWLGERSELRSCQVGELIDLGETV